MTRCLIVAMLISPCLDMSALAQENERRIELVPETISRQAQD